MYLILLCVINNYGLNSTFFEIAFTTFDICLLIFVLFIFANVFIRLILFKNIIYKSICFLKDTIGLWFVIKYNDLFILIVIFNPFIFVYITDVLSWFWQFILIYSANFTMHIFSHFNISRSGMHYQPFKIVFD